MDGFVKIILEINQRDLTILSQIIQKDQSLVKLAKSLKKEIKSNNTLIIPVRLIVSPFEKLFSNDKQNILLGHLFKYKN